MPECNPENEKCVRMPSINNDNDSDGDDDMSGAESQHSASTDPKADSSEADEPDSDSSELDETECDRRTAGFVKYMGKFCVTRIQTRRA